jgi:hypothetical protein
VPSVRCEPDVRQRLVEQSVGDGGQPSRDVLGIGEGVEAVGLSVEEYGTCPS